MSTEIERMSAVVAILFAVAIGLTVSLFFTVLSPRDQCKALFNPNKEISHNVCILPKSHEGYHVTADRRKFRNDLIKNSDCSSKNP